MVDAADAMAAAKAERERSALRDAEHRAYNELRRVCVRQGLRCGLSDHPLVRSSARARTDSGMRVRSLPQLLVDRARNSGVHFPSTGKPCATHPCR